MYTCMHRVYFRISLKGGQMLSTKIKGGSGLSTNYVIIIRCTNNPKGGVIMPMYVQYYSKLMMKDQGS